MTKKLKPALAIVSTCTNKKRGRPEKSCRLDACIQGTCALTAKKWLSSLQNSKHVKKPAICMYGGDHWKETLHCLDVARQGDFDADLWVLSAGWGLIPAEMPIVPYAATFAAGHDSVQNLRWPRDYTVREKSRAWWTELHKRRKLSDAPTLSDLPGVFGKKRKPTFLFIISREYFPAVEPDLVVLASKGSKVAIVSAGLYRERSIVSPLLKDFVLPLSDKFKQVRRLNKPNTSLNAHLATWIVRKYPKLLADDIDGLGRAVAKIGDSLPAMKRKKPKKMTDAQVLEFIDKHYDPATSSATKLLRRLRDRGIGSCEQKRFGGLFRDYVRSNRNKGLFDG